MTSKRNIETELDKLSDDVLPSLPPEYRLKMTMEAWASGDEETHEQLKDSAPLKEYRVTDSEFSDALNASLVLSLKAWFDLQTGRWRFLYEKLNGEHKDMLHRTHGDEWDWVEEPSEDDLFFEKAAMKAAAHFLKDYLAYERFAEEELGVPLETFLGVAFPRLRSIPSSTWRSSRTVGCSTTTSTRRIPTASRTTIPTRPGGLRESLSNGAARSTRLRRQPKSSTNNFSKRGSAALRSYDFSPTVLRLFPSSRTWHPDAAG